MIRSILPALAALLAGCAGTPRLVAPLRAPSGSGPTDARFRASAPPPTPIAIVSDGAPQEERLANGLRIVVLERHAYPVVTARLIIERGALDLGDDGGVREAQTELLYRYLGDFAVRGEVSRAVAQTGVGIDDMNGPDSITWRASGPASNFATACDFLFKATFGAHLTEDEYRHQSVLWRPLARGRVSLAAAERSILFDAHHPYGNNGSGTEVVSIPEARQIHDLLFRPGQATLLVVGDVDAGKAIEEATRVFGAVPVGAGPVVRNDQPAPWRSSPKLSIVGHRGLAHRSAAVFARGPQAGTAEEDAFDLLAHVLDGFGARILTDVREEMGATYALSSPLVRGRAASWLSIGGSYDGEKAVASVRAELNEIRRIRAGGVTAEEIEIARARMLGAYAARLSTVDGLASLYADAVIFGEPLSRVRELPARIAQLGRDELTQVAKAYLAPERLHVVFLGEDRWIDTNSLEMGALQTLELPP